MINLKEKQTLLLKLLKEVFETSNEKIYLRAGSLLGTIRHAGIIPWDSDIDLEIPIEKYRLVIEQLKKNKKINIFYESEKYENSFCRVGFKNVNHNNIHIDIFPMIGLSGNKIKDKILLKKISFWSNIRKIKYKKIRTIQTKWKKAISYFLYILKFPLILITNNTINKKTHKLETKYDFKESNYVVNPYSKYKEKSIFKKEYYSKLIEKEFEGIKVFVPYKYDEILTQLYGDYMSFPKGKENFNPESIKTNISYEMYKKIKKELKNETI